MKKHSNLYCTWTSHFEPKFEFQNKP